MSTGTGKSKVAIDFIKENAAIFSVLITSPRTNLKENWRKELYKWGLEHFGSDWWIVDGRRIHITIENVQTTYKWNSSFDLIIADEIHTMMTPEYSKALELGTQWLIGLTATHDITEENGKQAYYDKYAPIIYEYYGSAEDGLINKTQFFIVDHHLDNDTKVLVETKKETFMKGEADHYAYLTKRIEAGQRMMLAQGSTRWFQDAADWFWKGQGDKEQKFAAMMYLNSIKYRKDFLLSLNSTAIIARTIKRGILSGDKASKVLIFSELTKQIERATSKTIHSHNSVKVNQKRMDDFNEGRIRTLGSCQSLTLGLNLKGATHGIMESYIGSKTRSQQKKGRLDRLATDDVAEMWFIVVHDTQSVKWFESMSKAFDLSNAWHIDSKLIMNDGFDYTTSKVR